MDTFLKQPAEVFTFAADFTDRKAAGETLASAAVTAVKMSDGSDATSAVIASSSVTDPQVTVRVKAGVANEDYQISVQATTTTNEVYEKDILMQIRTE